MAKKSHSAFCTLHFLCRRATVFPSPSSKGDRARKAKIKPNQSEYEFGNTAADAGESGAGPRPLHDLAEIRRPALRDTSRRAERQFRFRGRRRRFGLGGGNKLRQQDDAGILAAGKASPQRGQRLYSSDSSEAHIRMDL
jgi:hypothetical protein